MFTDSILKPSGYFRVESVDSLGNILDVYEENNLIMDKARVNLAAFISGLPTSTPINKIVFGTEGHITGNLTIPKTATEGFVSSRSSLFSEQTASYEYHLGFVPTTNGGFATVTEDDASAGSTVQITLSGTGIQYIVELSQLAGNNGSSVNYTEAAFYCGTNIFSMKCFPVRVKDNSVKIKIYWSFQF